MLKTNSVLAFLLSVFVFSLALIVYFIYQHGGENNDLDYDIKLVGKLTDRKASFDDLSDFFGEIAIEKGAVYAYELMRSATLPFGLDQHLLGHVIGDILYEQEGINGMKYCTHDFRNACSHTIVIGALIEYGTGAFPKIQEACKQAPGGKGAYTMCYHGLGHGVLAFNEYDFNETIEMCGMLGTEEYNNREGVECFGGAIMEIIGGGGHDKETWAKMRKEYLDPKNPFGLCLSDIVPKEYKSMCYNYMTPYAFEAFGANMAYPDPEIYTKTFKLCNQISKDNREERQSCFGGLGKEFIGIATGRNFTPGIEPSKEELQTMINWCNLSAVEDGRMYCVNSTMDSLYWGGERPYETAIGFCSLVTETEVAKDCYNSLIVNVSIYRDDISYREAFCSDLPGEYRDGCMLELKI